MIKEAFPVTGMNCAACASSVESILSHTKGVQQAEVNFATELVWVEYDETISPQNLHEALNKVGYGLLWSDDRTGDELAEAQKSPSQVLPTGKNSNDCFCFIEYTSSYYWYGFY